MKKVSELRKIYRHVAVWGNLPENCASNVVKVSCYYGEGATNCIDMLALKG
jgi:hypothetical protein